MGGNFDLKLVCRSDAILRYFTLSPLRWPELKATLIKQKIVKALKLCQRKQERKMWSNDQVGCLRIGQLLARLRLPVLLSAGAGASDRVNCFDLYAAFLL